MAENARAWVVCIWRHGANHDTLEGVIASRSFFCLVMLSNPDTEFDPRRLKGIALCRPRQRGARMVESDFIARRKRLHQTWRGAWKQSLLAAPAWTCTRPAWWPA